MDRRERGEWWKRRNGEKVSGRGENGRGKEVRFEGFGWRARVAAERRVGMDEVVMGEEKKPGWGDYSWAWSQPDTGGQGIAGPSNEHQGRT